MVLGYEHTHLFHGEHYRANQALNKVPFGHTRSPRRTDVPKWDLVAAPGRTNSRWPMQISPLFSSPQRLRSGRLAPAPRSASAPAPEPIRVLIGDGDGDFRRALRASFAADPRIEVVGGAQALQLVRLLRPNVALIDEDMPSLGGAAIARILSSELPETRVVVLTRPLAGVCR